MDKTILKGSSGYTLIEIIVVMMVFGVLYGVVSLNLLSVRHKSSMNSELNILIADIRSVQLDGMTGKPDQNNEPVNHGIYFESGQYTIFSGSSYNPSDPSNFVIKLQDNISFSQIPFENSNLIFTRLSGEIRNYDPSKNFLTILNTLSNESRKITFNKLGSIVDVQ